MLSLTYLLTYSMEQSPSWEANWSAASQEIPRILWNPKVHHCTPKRTPPVPIHPVHTPTSHFPKIHPNIILPSRPGSPQWSPSLRFPHQNPVHTSPLPHTRYMPLEIIVSRNARWTFRKQQIPLKHGYIKWRNTERGHLVAGVLLGHRVS